MFTNGYLESFVDGIQRIKNSQDDREFQKNVNLISDYMKKQQMSLECWQRLDRLSFYEICESESETKENRELAKDRVINYIRKLMRGSDVTLLIEDILENFYMFLEALKERTPHKTAGIQKKFLIKLI